MTNTPKPKRLNLLGALGDFTILVLLIAGAGFAGYYIGLNQRLAPVQMVWPGTPGAIPLSQILGPQPTIMPADASQSTTTSSAATASSSSSKPDSTSAKPDESSTKEPAKQPVTNANVKRKTKFWLSSSGMDDYVGYSITVKVNGTTVDNFFGAGKTIDISKHVKKGQNNLEFDCKYMGEDYNNHKGDAKASLTVQLVSGPSIREDYAQSAVLLSVKRNAAETTDFSEKKTFSSKE